MQNLARTPDRIDALVAAFTAAEYAVDGPDNTIVIRVGEATPVLDQLLNDSPWAVITAHNPDGRLCAAGTNATAQRSLEESLRELQPAVLLSVSNRDPEGRWPDEPAWLFTLQSLSQADRLARRFGQRAILSGLPGAPAQLRMYDDRRGVSGTAPGTAS